MIMSACRERHNYFRGNISNECCYCYSNHLCSLWSNWRFWFQLMSTLFFGYVLGCLSLLRHPGLSQLSNYITSCFNPPKFCLVNSFFLDGHWQIFHDSENLWTSSYGFLAALLFCGHTYIAGNQIVKQYDTDIEAPISAVVYSYWTFLYYLKPVRD